MNRKRLLKLIEKELVVILAIMLLLGIIVGYSLAASNKISVQPNTTIMGAELGGAGEEIIK